MGAGRVAHDHNFRVHSRDAERVADSMLEALATGSGSLPCAHASIQQRLTRAETVLSIAHRNKQAVGANIAQTPATLCL